MNPIRKINIQTTLLLLVFLLPSSFQLTPPAISLGAFHVTLVEIFLFLLLFHWIFDVLTTQKWVVSPLDRLFFLLLAYICFSLVYGSVRHGTFMALADFRQFLPLFLYFWATRYFGNSNDLTIVRRRIFIVMFCVAIYVLVVFLFFRGALAADIRMANRVFFDNTLLLLMIYSGYLLSQAIRAKAGGYAFALLGLNALMLLVMQVRTYWLAFAFTLGAEAVRYRFAFLRSRVFLLAVYLSITLVSTCALMLEVVPVSHSMEGVITSISDRVNSVLNLWETLFEFNKATGSSEETIGTRAVTAQVIWDDYVMKNPIFGTGLGGELPLLSPFGAIVLMKFQIDNGYLTILAKFGFIGFGLYGLIIWSLCRSLLRIIKSPFASLDEKLLARSFLFGIIAMMIASIFSSIFIRQQPILLGFLILLAEIAVMQRNIQIRKINSSQSIESSN